MLERPSPAQQGEIAVTRPIAALPPAAKRVIAGAPIRRDGLQLDLDVQLLVRLYRLRPDPPLRAGTPQEARARLRDAVRGVEGPEIGGVGVAETSVQGAAGALAARLSTAA